MENQTIGQYRVEQEIGRGGMATVYRATQLSLGRPVALKVLAHNLTSDPGLVERFHHEAVIASHLSHPNIVQVYDTGKDAGSYYIAMEFIDGPTLAQVIKAKGALEIPHAVAVALSAAEALALAHARGVVHRDIKPANIMQTMAGRVVVMDFGIARAALMSSLTVTGTTIGTPAYMSPEQAMGRKADARTDLYALGVVLYQALIGRVPFEADTPVATLLQHAHQPPPDMRQIRPEIPIWLDLVVRCCLAKDPNSRYQRADDLCADLREGTRSGRAPVAEALARAPGFAQATVPTVFSGADKVPGAAGRRKAIGLIMALIAVLAIGILGAIAFIVFPLMGSQANYVKAGGGDKSSTATVPSARGNSGEQGQGEVTSSSQDGTVPAKATPGEANVAPLVLGSDFVEDLGDGSRLAMVYIPGGNFRMGSPASEKEIGTDEGPQHFVTVGPFWSGKYEVTQAQWQAVMGDNPSKFLGDDRPVERISWNNAEEFCRRLSSQTGRDYRLPTEAQWEYACRAGSGTRYFFGSSAGPLGDYAWFDKLSGGASHTVGQKSPNPWGLYDMYGNVWEWCEDTYHASYAGAPADGSAWTVGGDGRVLRGGSWLSYAKRCRSAFRDKGTPAGRYNYIGLRVVVLPR